MSSENRNLHFRTILWNFLYRTLEPYLENYIKEFLLKKHIVWGEVSQLEIAQTAIVNNALFNVTSGKIIIRDYVFFGHNVCVLTGTHDYSRFGYERQTAIPKSGRDIIVNEGVWVASNATILGPCVIGEHSVVAVGSVVNEDVPAYSVVAGIPAKVIKNIQPP